MSEEGSLDLAVDNLGNGVLSLPFYRSVEHRVSWGLICLEGKSLLSSASGWIALSFRPLSRRH